MGDRAGFSGTRTCNYTNWPASSKGNCALIVIKGCEDFFSTNITT
jgi:hypothetical protein